MTRVEQGNEGAIRVECLRKKLAQDRDRRQGSKAFVFHPKGNRL